jgi:hypothetical protein
MSAGRVAKQTQSNAVTCSPIVGLADNIGQRPEIANAIAHPRVGANQAWRASSRDMGNRSMAVVAATAAKVGRNRLTNFKDWGADLPKSPKGTSSKTRPHIANARSAPARQPATLAITCNGLSAREMRTSSMQVAA